MQAVLPRNDLRQYDEMADVWWDPCGPFASLQWIAKARADLIPVAKSADAVLLDLACGAGLLAPHVADKNYHHIGLDITSSALFLAKDHGVTPVRGNVLALPFPDSCADVVSAGEILEHVSDVDSAVAEACRVLKPGGLVVVDTIANTTLGKFIAVTIGERIPSGAPRGIHDPNLFVDRSRLIASFARHGVNIQLRGLRPSLHAWFLWKVGRRKAGAMVPTRSTAVLFQAWGTKQTPVAA